jgi:Domain of unknown function (DUF4194)
VSNIFDRMMQELEQGAEPTHDSTTPKEAENHRIAELEGGSPSTSREVKLAAQELIKHGFLEEAKRADLFRRTIVLQKEVQAVLEPLDLVLKIDSHRGIAFLITSGIQSTEQEGEEDEWSHPLVRRQRLTLEQSILIAILRKAFVMHEQETGVGSRDAIMAVEDLLPQFMVYFGDTGSDVKNESKLLNLLDQLKTYGIVSEVDKKQEIVIRPLIAHLANPESLTALLQVLQQKAKENLSDKSVSPMEPEC